MCVVRRQHPPTAMISWMVVQIPRRVIGSRPVVGSSRIVTAGEAIMAQPTARRRRMPPLRVSGIQSLLSFRRIAAKIRSTQRSASGPTASRKKAKKQRFSSTVRSPLMHVSWGHRPTQAPLNGTLMATLPSQGRSSPVMHRMVVVFPLPFGPKSPSMVPGMTLKLTSLRTFWPGEPVTLCNQPYRCTSPLTSSTAPEAVPAAPLPSRAPESCSGGFWRRSSQKMASQVSFSCTRTRNTKLQRLAGGVKSFSTFEPKANVQGAAQCGTALVTSSRVRQRPLTQPATSSNKAR
mmetsp:Transcript_119724/g.382140  ORF Transcript_119724/g.382140 Transcript_119724/m.382140 type:complete len:291 (+) Transcript_119724:485-1357(+)